MRKLLTTIWRIITSPFRFLWWIIRVLYRWLANLGRNTWDFFTLEVDDSPVTESFSKVVQQPQSVIPHLIALRGHIMRSVLAIVITTFAAFAFIQPILEFLSQPLEGGLESLVAIEVTEPIGTVMRVSLLTGITIAFPYLVLEFYIFIAAGLKRRTRVLGLLSIPFAIALFLGGLAFSYYILLPKALPFLLNFMGIATIPRPSSYIRFTTGLMFWIGIAFEFPLVIFLLAVRGWVNARMLAKQWRLGVLAIAILSAVITPTVDPVNMSLVMGPMIVLFIFSIGLAKFGELLRGQKPQEETH